MSIFGTFSLPIPEAEKVNLYPLTKTDREVSDNTLLATIASPVQGDIAVIDSVIDEVNTNKTAYMWDGTQWVALNGNVEADKVIHAPKTGGQNRSAHTDAHATDHKNIDKLPRQSRSRQLGIPHGAEHDGIH